MGGIFQLCRFFYFQILDRRIQNRNTVAKWVYEDFINMEVVFAGLIAAIAWNLITWWFGIPSSSSHTLMGGFLGAALAHAGGLTKNGHNVINYGKVIPTFLFIFLAPLIGMIIAYIITVIILHICKKAIPHKADKWFRRLQLLSSALFCRTT